MWSVSPQSATELTADKELIEVRPRREPGTGRAGAAWLAILLLAGCASPTAAPHLTRAVDPASAFALRACDEVEARLPQLTALAEQVADRQLAGGMLGVIWEPPSATGPQGPQYEIKGRSGGLTAMDVPLARRLGEADRARDTAIIGWQREPGPTDTEILKRYRERFFIIAFGPRDLPALAPCVELCDAWIDTGLGGDDRLLTLPGGTPAGHGNVLVNALNAWVFQAELIAALTRRGRMPTMLQSHMWEDSRAWNERYRGKMAFHDDLTIDPVPAGALGRQYLDRIRVLVRRFAATQRSAVEAAADRIVAEVAAGRRTIVAVTGHTAHERVGKYEDRVWAVPVVLHATTGRIKQYPDLTPDGALVLRLGYSGLDENLAAVMRRKQQRIMLITSTHDPRPAYRLTDDMLSVIDTGWEFGDACVRVPGYPIRILPPSGVMQLVAYEAVHLAVMGRLPADL